MNWQFRNQELTKQGHAFFIGTHKFMILKIVDPEYLTHTFFSFPSLMNFEYLVQGPLSDQDKEQRLVDYTFVKKLGYFCLLYSYLKSLKMENF